MKTEIDLQKYFSSIDENEYEISINERIEEPFKSLIYDIGLLLETNLFLKDSEELGVYRELVFRRLKLINNGEYINCIFSIYKIKDGNFYIQMAKKIAQFFNEEFPYEAKELNIGLPIRKELISGYELKDVNNNLLYSAGISLSNELSEIRFTFYKI